MRIIADSIWLCGDCTYVACNGPYGIDLSPILAERIAHGLAEFGSHLVPNFDSETGDGLLEYSGVECASCKTTMAGYRARFAILGEKK